METRVVRLAVETKLAKFAVLICPERLAVETKFARFAVETCPTRLAVEIYPAEPRPITVEVSWEAK